MDPTACVLCAGTGTLIHPDGHPAPCWGCGGPAADALVVLVGDRPAGRHAGERGDALVY